MSDRVTVLIICAAGMSSSLLIKAIENAGVEAELTIEVITYHSIGSANWNFVKNPVDIVMIAPQIRFFKKSIETLASLHGIPVVVMEPSVYGMADGGRLLQQVMNVLNGVRNFEKED